VRSSPELAALLYWTPTRLLRMLTRLLQLGADAGWSPWVTALLFISLVGGLLVKLRRELLAVILGIVYHDSVDAGRTTLEITDEVVRLEPPRLNAPATSGTPRKRAGVQDTAASTARAQNKQS
jgi:hypothetical protein